MKGLAILLILAALGGGVFMFREMAAQNDRLNVQVHNLNQKIADLNNQLKAARATDQADNALIQANLEQLKLNLDRERVALDAARARANQIHGSGISNEDIAKAEENVRLEKDQYDGVLEQLRVNRATQADLNGQRKSGEANGASTKAINDQEFNAEIAAHTNRIADLKAQIAALKGSFDPLRQQKIQPMNDQIRLENDAIATLRQNRQTYSAQYNAEKGVFEADAQTKLQKLKIEEDALRSREASEKVDLAQLQKILADLRNNRNNRAGAIKQADQDLADHQKKVAALEQQLSELTRGVK